MARQLAKQKHQTLTKSGTLAHIRINGSLHQKHFRRGADPLTIRQWLLSVEMKYRRPGTQRTGRFDADARAYLEAVRAMATFSQREQHIREWIATFSDRPRDGILPDEIRAQLQAWRATMSAASVNKRRSALMHLYSVLDGRAARNPVRDVPKFAEPAPALRALPYEDIRAIFAAMSPSKSKARLMVIAYTGIPHAEIAMIAPTDVDVHVRNVAVHGRKKGKGTLSRIVPLTSDGVMAFQMMAREDAWGKFSRATLRNVFRRACKRALGRDDFTPYDLRHSFGTEMYRVSGDIRATQVLMDHSTPQLTHRYTLGAVDPRVATAISKWHRSPTKDKR